MNSGDVHRHQAHPPLAQHVAVGGGNAAAGAACGWFSAAAVPPAPLSAAPAAPTAPARVKRLQPPPHQLPNGGGGGGVGGGGGGGAGAPLSPSALHNLSASHASGGMTSSVRVPPAGGSTVMHTSLGPASCCPWPRGDGGGAGGKGASDLLVTTSLPPSWLANMSNMPCTPTYPNILSGIYHTAKTVTECLVELFESDRAAATMTSELSEYYYKPGKVLFYVPPEYAPEWHHGAISRERAEQLLAGAADGVFLVRESTNFPGDHTLCVRYRGRVEHYRVKWAPPAASVAPVAAAAAAAAHRLTIDDEEFFCNMSELIEHYLKDADGLCTRLVRYLPKQMANGTACGNSTAAQQHSQPAYSASQPPPTAFHPPHAALQPLTQPPSQPAPFPPSHAPAGAAAPPPTFCSAHAPPPHRKLSPADQTDGGCLAPQAFVDLGWMISERDLEIRENIGKGEFGDVMLGILNGTQKVAVKILKDREAASKFLAEASLMTSLKDDNLVRLLGLVFSSNGSTCIVTEHMAQGSLLDYLRSRGRHYVTQRHQINFAYDACCGMEYLEKRHVVHRDLAARNVLIARDGTAKVADFGLARPDASRPDDPHAQAKLPIKWTAPEALKYNIFSNKSDMWSFGILLWEIYSFGRVPYPRIPLAEVVRVVENGHRMDAPDGCPPEPFEVMRAAWHSDPAQRPSFQHTRQRLHALRDATPPAPPPHDPPQVLVVYQEGPEPWIDTQVLFKH